MAATPAPNSSARRARWLSTLAKARHVDLKTLWENLPRKPEWQRLKPPETGMVMVRGRIGGDGGPFNVGEMTVTRCVVRLEGGAVGVGYVAGRDAEQAELIAVIDAMAQDPVAHKSVADGVIEPLALLQRRLEEAASRKAAASRVEFFTVARGDET
jgi:alpha-D-ribose 1-methylphosphonate 5-triphosphate synthase subunit PhnG